MFAQCESCIPSGENCNVCIPALFHCFDVLWGVICLGAQWSSCKPFFPRNKMVAASISTSDVEVFFIGFVIFFNPLKTSLGSEIRRLAFSDNDGNRSERLQVANVKIPLTVEDRRK
jgi:hypothetical protein